MRMEAFCSNCPLVSSVHKMSGGSFLSTVSVTVRPARTIVVSRTDTTSNFETTTEQNRNSLKMIVSLTQKRMN
jgi:hypothetical protein